MSDAISIASSSEFEPTGAPTQSPGGLLSVYDGCDVTKTCFGLPPGCLNSKSCVSFGAVIVKNSTYTFEMQSSSESFMNQQEFLA